MGFGIKIMVLQSDQFAKYGFKKYVLFFSRNMSRRERINLKKEKALPRPGIIQSPCGLSGFEPGTFRSSVWRSPNWAISADVQCGENLLFYFQRRIVSLA